MHLTIASIWENLFFLTMLRANISSKVNFDNWIVLITCFMAYQISNNKEPLLRCAPDIWTFRDYKLAQEGPILQSLRSRKSYPSASTDSFEALQNCRGAPYWFHEYIYILAYNQSYILVYIIQVYIRTAWNDFYDHSQNNALALVSLTDLRLKYQQLLFGLTTFCLFKRA